MTESFLVEKDKDAVLDYTVDWTEWLEGADQIANVTWVVPSGITKVNESKTDYIATIWLSGGTADVTYKVVCRVATDEGRIDDRVINVRVVER